MIDFVPDFLHNQSRSGKGKIRKSIFARWQGSVTQVRKQLSLAGRQKGSAVLGNLTAIISFANGNIEGDVA